MNPFKRLLSSLFNSWKKLTLPNYNKINKTGIINSDYPKVDNGWIKGWVVNVQPKNIIIVCSHAGPSTSSPNNRFFVKDKFGNKIYRNIVAMDTDPYKLDGKKLSEKSDIAICRVDEPFPDSIIGYDFSTDLYVENSPVVNFRQNGKPSPALVHTWKEKAWVRGMKRNNDDLLVYGDSGTPWFVWENRTWKVITHTYLGQHGEGPWYSHPYIFKDIKERIKKLQDS